MSDRNIISVSSLKLGLDVLILCNNNVNIFCEGLGVSLGDVFRIEFSFKSNLDSFLFWFFICLDPSDDSRNLYWASNC